MNARTWKRCVCAAIVVWAAAAIAVAGPIEGRFRLVEQRYENGPANVSVQDSVLRVEFAREGGTLAGKVWVGDDAGAALPWPAFANDLGPLPVEVLERGEDPFRGELRARYRVKPSPTDDLVLEVTESFRSSEDGLALEGTMTVRFTGGATNRGGFTLHRRFERER